MNTPPIALTIAGSDCSAGAGIQADLKTFQVHDVYGLSAVTCVVSETPLEVDCIHCVPLDVLESQIRLLLQTYPVAAIKIGMLGSLDIAQAVYGIICNYSSIPIVIDPVILASTGDAFMNDETVNFYKTKLLPVCTVITPNIPEAIVLAEADVVVSEKSQERELAAHLSKVYQTATVVKGGHSKDKNAVDCLWSDNEYFEYSSPRLNLTSTHGTGCTFSSALCAGLAKGQSIQKATENAKSFVYEAMKNRFTWHSPNKKEIYGLNHKKSQLEK